MPDLIQQMEVRAAKTNLTRALPLETIIGRTRK
jgi:hypothetical protein